MSEYNGVWIYSENYDLTLEMLSKAVELAEKRQTEATALLIGHEVKNAASELMSCGANKVLVVDNPELKGFQSEKYLSALATLVKDRKPEVLLIGSTRKGRELAARLATRFETGCVPDCTNLSLDEQGRLITERVVYGGSASVTQVSMTKPQIACVPPRTFEKASKMDRRGEVVDAAISQLEAPKTETVEVKPVEAAAVKVEEATVVVVGGRGLEKKEDFKILESLSQLLGGQIGWTRPLAEDRKWFTNWVGLSGKKTKPTLYIGCGISGMIQHVAGMRDSNVVVTVNKDPEAPIFEVADYIVVGDLYEIVPALVEALKKELKK